MSLFPASAVMKPKPLPALKNLTVPFGMLFLMIRGETTPGGSPPAPFKPLV
jgi:hypothetical protein